MTLKFNIEIRPNEEHKDPRPSLWGQINNKLKAIGNNKEKSLTEKSEHGGDRNVLAKLNNVRISDGSKNAKAHRENGNKTRKGQVFSFKFRGVMCDAIVTPIDRDGIKFAYRITTFLDKERGGIANAKSDGFYTYEMATKFDFIAWLRSGTESIKDGINIADLNEQGS